MPTNFLTVQPAQSSVERLPATGGELLLRRHETLEDETRSIPQPG
jgi:hypothetical protein